MVIPRELIYEEKPSLEDFGINDEGTLNNRIYDEWLLLTKELDPEDEYYYSKITKVFNDAYFMCTVALLSPSKEIKLSYFKNRIKHTSIVYPMVYLYLSLLPNRARNTDRLLKMINNVITNHHGMEKSLTDIITAKKIGKIEASLFTRRQFTSDFLSTLDWAKITERYNPEEIKKIIYYIAKNEEEREMMAEAILNAAKQSEDEFYNPSSYDYEDDNEQNDFENNEPIDDYYEPDYSEAYQLCTAIIDNSEQVSLSIEEENNNTNTYAPERRLKDLLNKPWFDTFSTEKVKYNVEWREKLVEDLLKSKYGTEIVKTWPTKCNMIKCSLVGGLLKVGVLEGKIKELAHSVHADINNVQENNVADYIGSKGRRPYLSWLQNYVNTDNSEPFSD